MSTGKILLLENIHPGAKARFEENGYEVELLNTALADADLIAAMDGAVAVGIRSKTQMTAEVLAAAGSLRAVGAFCIGTNQIALDKAHALAVPVFNAPFSNTRSVAELVIAEVVMLARKASDRSMQMHQGLWKKSAIGSHEVRGKTLGIIGYGHIGRQVGVLAEAFGMNVLFHDIANQLPMGNNTPSVGLDELLERSRFVTLHVPATMDTANMIGEAELRKMQKGAYLLNLSRGNVVVIDDLVAVLKDGHLAGAALDVYPEEPAKRDSTFQTPLAGLDNVILTPHVGGSTVEAQVAIGQEVSTALLKYLQAGATAGAVNFPTIEMPTRKNATRIQHVHDNVPGVLQDVHSVVAAQGMNILGEALTTDVEIGYLLMDVVGEATETVVTELSKLETTRRVRSLS